jgi:hypothetical protein
MGAMPANTAVVTPPAAGREASSRERDKSSGARCITASSAQRPGSSGRWLQEGGGGGRRRREERPGGRWRRRWWWSLTMQSATSTPHRRIRRRRVAVLLEWPRRARILMMHCSCCSSFSCYPSAHGRAHITGCLCRPAPQRCHVACCVWLVACCLLPPQRCHLSPSPGPRVPDYARQGMRVPLYVVLCNNPGKEI